MSSNPANTGFFPLPADLSAQGDQSDQEAGIAQNALGFLHGLWQKCPSPLWELRSLDAQVLKLAGWQHKFPKEVTGSDGKQDHSCFESWVSRLIYLCSVVQTVKQPWLTGYIAF